MSIDVFAECMFLYSKKKFVNTKYILDEVYTRATAFYLNALSNSVIFVINNINRKEMYIITYIYM